MLYLYDHWVDSSNPLEGHVSSFNYLPPHRRPGTGDIDMPPSVCLSVHQV